MRRLSLLMPSVRLISLFPLVFLAYFSLVPTPSLTQQFWPSYVIPYTIRGFSSTAEIRLKEYLEEWKLMILNGPDDPRPCLHFRFLPYRPISSNSPTSSAWETYEGRKVIFEKRFAVQQCCVEMLSCPLL